ncbi:hypothetical protein VP01_5668g2, partial [Puccinia sorghi]
PDSPPQRKTHVARDGLRFEMLKFEWKVKNDDKVRRSGITGSSWRRRSWTGKRRRKKKDRSFEMAKLEQLASQENIGKKYDLSTQCVVSRKSPEEIHERLVYLFK